MDEIVRYLDQAVEFWRLHSCKSRFGGFFNCLANDGQVVDTTKYAWLQGRQVWTFAYLFNNFERFRTPELLDATVKGAEFMIKNIYDKSTGRCYFSVRDDGCPLQFQRGIFTESFFVLGLSELYLAQPNQQFKDLAQEVYKTILAVVFEQKKLFDPKFREGFNLTRGIAVPMVILWMGQILRKIGCEDEKATTWAVEECLLHLQTSSKFGEVVLENLTDAGVPDISTYQGRSMIPGHAIEIGWFLLEEAKHRKDDKLAQKVIVSFIDKPFEIGWDKEFGGLYYFLDSEGHCPVQLEWSMKLWWSHCEALIAMLLAYQYTKNDKYLHNYTKIWTYVKKHFVDNEHGEWYGYCDRRGNVTHTWKGGPFKGCFHVPRCLAMCEQILRSSPEMLARLKDLTPKN